jgi:hypothetical protein
MTMDDNDQWGVSDHDQERSVDEWASAREFFERFAWDGVWLDPATTRAADYLAQL